MPIVLSQRDWQGDPKYLDREWIIYHYPDRYRPRVKAYDKFIYHRPGRGAIREERSTYFGHGILGAPYADVARPGYWWVDIIWSEKFPQPVPLRDADGSFFETESRDIEPQFQFYAMRPINETAFYRILAAARIAPSLEFSPLVTSESVLLTGYAGPHDAPKDDLRQIDRIPDGTGYVPRATERPDPHETAALQERARADHQSVLELIRQKVTSLGGVCFYNNNIDLLAKVGEARYLIEAKSLNKPNSAVDRMRYGIGQLFDYRVRYRAEIAGAEPVLAFGSPPTRDVSWIPSILDETGISFVAAVGERVNALNEHAQKLPFIN